MLNMFKNYQNIYIEIQNLIYFSIYNIYIFVKKIN